MGGSVAYSAVGGLDVEGDDGQASDRAVDADSPLTAAPPTAARDGDGEERPESTPQPVRWSVLLLVTVLAVVSLCALAVYYRQAVLPRRTALSRAIPYTLSAGVPRLVSLSALPYLQSDRVSSHHVSSAHNYHADFNGWLYRSTLRTPVDGLAILSSYNQQPPVPLQTSGPVLQVLYEGQEGPACIDSIAFAFTGPCEEPGHMAVVIETMDMAQAEDSLTNGTWQLRSVLPFANLSVHDTHRFTAGARPVDDLAGLFRRENAAECWIYPGAFLVAPLCYAASERLRVSVLWLHAAKDRVWYALHDCMATNSVCPYGVYYNLWYTRFVDDEPSVPRRAVERQRAWQRGPDAQLSQHSQRVAAYLQQQYGHPLDNTSASSPPSALSSFHVPPFRNHLSSVAVLREMSASNPAAIHPIYATEAFEAGREAVASEESDGELHRASVISEHVFQPAPPASGSAERSGMWAVDDESSRVSCAADGSLTPLFHLSLTAAQEAAGGATIVGLRLSTPLASLRSNWTGFDLVVFFDGGDSHTRVYPQPDAATRQWRAEGVTGRAQIDVPISMLFTVGSPAGRALQPTGSPLARYFERQQRSVGELLAPMPFWRSVHVYLRNRQQSAVSVGVSVHGRYDVHYSEALAGHLYAHYFFAQTTATGNIPDDMRLTDEPRIQRHWAEQLTRNVSTHGATETSWGLKQAAAANPTADPSTLTASRAWCGSYDPGFPSYVLSDDQYGHNPDAPRGSFHLPGSEQQHPGVWQLHAFRGLTGRVVQWSLHFTTTPHFLVESDIRVTTDDTLWMSSTGLEDVFFGAHGYYYRPFNLDRADFGWWRERRVPGADDWYNMRMFRNWQGAGPVFGDSLVWGVEAERHVDSQWQSVLLLYGKPTSNTSQWRSETTDTFAIGCDEQLAAHDYRLVLPNASTPTGLAEAPPRSNEYVLVDGQAGYLLKPNSDLWRRVNEQLYTETHTGQLLTGRAQVHFTVALDAQHAQCWLVRRVDSCSSVQAARLYIRRAEWRGGKDSRMEWAALAEEEAAAAAGEWLDGGLWYSQLPPCPHVQPEGRMHDIRHPLPFAATRGRSRVTIALDVQPHLRSAHDGGVTINSSSWEVDSAYLAHREWSNRTMEDPPALEGQPLRGFTHFRYSVRCSRSPFYG